MTEGKDNSVQRAIDGIELDKKAERRMYENILKKAERKSTGTKLIGIVKPAASAAACVCLVIAAAVLLKEGVNNSAELSGGVYIKDQSADLNDAEENAVFDIADVERFSEISDRIAEYGYGEAEADADGTYAGAPQDSAYIDADGTATVTTVFDIGFEINEGTAFSTAVPGAAPSEGEEADVFDGLGFDLESDFAFNDAAEGAEKVSEETAETLPFNFPGGVTRIVYTDTSSDRLSADFMYKGHSYTVVVSSYDTEREDIVYEDIGEYSDSDAVMYSEEYNGISCYRVRWSSGEYWFLIMNNDGASREEMIEISTLAVTDNR